MRNFVGRRQWVGRFNDYMHPNEGLVWRITGVPGIGKTTLLKRFAERCEEAERAHVFLDIDGFQAGHGLDVLSELSKSARYFDTEKTNKTLREKLGERFVQYKAGLGSVLEAGKLVDPSGGLISGGAKVLLDLGAGLAGSTANMSEEAAAANPELFLLEALAAAADGDKKPVCLVDTFEHALAGDLKLQSRLDFGFAEPRESTLKTQPQAGWLTNLFEFLRSKGWRIVIVGRNMPGADQQKDQLARFTREEMYQATEKRPALAPYLSEQSDAILNVLSTLSFEGNPLWLQVAMNLVENLLAAGEDIEELAEKPDYLQECFEEEDPFDMGGDFGMESGRCKLQLIGTLTRHIEGLEDQAWKIALPRVLDKGIVRQLFEPEQARAILHNFQVAGVFRHSGEQFSLHEEIRDLLLAYARSKGWLDTEETREIHRQLWEYLNTNYLEKLPLKLTTALSSEYQSSDLNDEDLIDILVEIDTQLIKIFSPHRMLEACYHRVFSLKELSNNTVTPITLWSALAQSTDLPIAAKWMTAKQLPNMNSLALSQLIELLSQESEKRKKILGKDTALAIASVTLSGKHNVMQDVDFWQRRVYKHGAAGDYLQLQSLLSDQPEFQIKVIQEMVDKYLGSNEETVQLQCAKALHYQGNILEHKLNNPKCAIATYDLLLNHFSGSNRPEMQVECAKTMYEKARTLGEKLDQIEDEIEIYDKLFEQFSQLKQPEIQIECITALINKAGILANKFNQVEEAITTYDKLTQYIGEPERPWAQGPLAMILLSKAEVLAYKAKRPKDDIFDSENNLSTAIVCFEELINRYGESDNPQVQQQCQSARTSLAELALITDQPQIALKYINQVLEQTTPENEEHAIMPFLRWLADPETPQQTVLTAIRQLAPEVEFNWDWDNILVLINQLPEPVKNQAECYVAYFEEHQDIEKLEANLQRETT